MIHRERQLCELMRVAVGAPPHRLNAESVRHRAARRRATTVLATVAILLAGGLGAIVSARAAGLGGGSSPAGGSGVPAGVPRFYVEQGLVSSGHPQNVVRARKTGAVTGRVRCPWPAAHPIPMSVAAAEHQTFFAVCDKMTGPGPGAVVTASRIYRFKVTATGRVAGYSLVRGGVLDGQRAGWIAATPDGTEIAVSVTPGNAQGTPAPSIIVINTRTGAHAVWQGTPDVPGTIKLSVGALSLTRDGRELVFLTQPHCIKGKNPRPSKDTGGERKNAL